MLSYSCLLKKETRSCAAQPRQGWGGGGGQKALASPCQEVWVFFIPLTSDPWAMGPNFSIQLFFLKVMCADRGNCIVSLLNLPLAGFNRFARGWSESGSNITGVSYLNELLVFISTGQRALMVSEPGQTRSHKALDA